MNDQSIAPEMATDIRKQIITTVVLHRQPVTLRTVTGEEFDVIWNVARNRTEIVSVAEGVGVATGIIKTIKWLDAHYQGAEWSHQTSRHQQPESNTPTL
ncbi:hypothetical protein RKD55_004643 [Rossellomorea marisflavi]